MSKANNIVGYAQCRDDECNLVCGWECRVLLADVAAKASAVKRGGQSWKSAVRMLVASPRQAVASGSSPRLGSVIRAAAL